MEEQGTELTPTRCPTCNGDLLVTKLECSACGAEVNGRFTLSNLASLPEPHASLLEMFLRVRGNVKEMERELGLSYPTVRARLEEALQAAGFPKESASETEGVSWEARFEDELAERIRSRVEQSLAGMQETLERVTRRAGREADVKQLRKDVLDRLERGEIAAPEAADLLREIKKRS